MGKMAQRIFWIAFWIGPEPAQSHLQRWCDVRSEPTRRGGAWRNCASSAGLPLRGKSGKAHGILARILAECGDAGTGVDVRRVSR